MATALVTGASSGIGKEFAWQLAARGHDVVVVARREDQLRLLAHQIHAAAGVEVEVLPADLTDHDDLDRVAARLRDTQRPVSLLVNNAGAPIGRFLRKEATAHERDLDLMVRAPMVLAHAAAEAMTARGAGAICNVGSMAGLLTSGTYSAYKAWMQVFSESLALELAGTGVTVTDLRPGLVKTGFFPGTSASAYPAFAWIEVGKLVSAALDDVAAGRVLSTPTLRYKAAALAMRLLPRPAVRLVSKLRNRR